MNSLFQKIFLYVFKKPAYLQKDFFKGVGRNLRRNSFQFFHAFLASHMFNLFFFHYYPAFVVTKKYFLLSTLPLTFLLITHSTFLASVFFFGAGYSMTEEKFNLFLQDKFLECPELIQYIHSSYPNYPSMAKYAYQYDNKLLPFIEERTIRALNKLALDIWKDEQNDRFCSLPTLMQEKILSYLYFPDLTALKITLSSSTKEPNYLSDPIYMVRFRQDTQHSNQSKSLKLS